MDDIQKDSAAHTYQWGMILEDDLIQDPVQEAFLKSSAADRSFPDDVIIGEARPDAKAARFMLVRTLSDEGRTPGNGTKVETFELPNQPNKPIEMHRLCITRHAVAPDFKVLLYPYHAGQEQPRTIWNADHTAVSVEWSNQKDEVTFSKGTDRRTRIKIARGGKDIVAVP